MSIIVKEEKNGCLFGLWELKESDEQLLDRFSYAPKEEQEGIKIFKNPIRRAERIAARLLIYDLLNKKPIVVYDDYGKPSLLGDERKISISHTQGMVAVQICKENAGLDIEKISGRVAKIAHKFLSAKELNYIDLNNQLLHMYAYWCAKETIYKIYGKKRLDFKKHIQIDNFTIKDKGNIKARLLTTNEQSFNLDYFIYNQDNKDKYMIVRCCV